MTKEQIASVWNDDLPFAALQDGVEQSDEFDITEFGELEITAKYEDGFWTAYAERPDE